MVVTAGDDIEYGVAVVTSVEVAGLVGTGSIDSGNGVVETTATGVEATATGALVVVLVGVMVGIAGGAPVYVPVDGKVDTGVAVACDSAVAEDITGVMLVASVTNGVVVVVVAANGVVVTVDTAGAVDAITASDCNTNPKCW